MSIRNNIAVLIVLIAASAISLIVYYATHIEFLLHIAAIPLEILVAVFIVEVYLNNRQTKERRRQLMHIKSVMFRQEMRNLFIANFLVLKSPPITISRIKTATLAELKNLRRAADVVEYQSLESMESLLMEYVNAERTWRNFMNIAFDYGFEGIFDDMIRILNLISDVKTFKEANPGKPFIDEAVKDPLLMQRVMTVLGDGIRKFLDYAIELREKQPGLLDEIVSDYELCTEIHFSPEEFVTGHLRRDSAEATR